MVHSASSADESWLTKVANSGSIVAVRSQPSGGSVLCLAGIAQLVERNLAKVEVAGSNPVARLHNEGSLGR